MYKGGNGPFERRKTTVFRNRPRFSPKTTILGLANGLRQPFPLPLVGGSTTEPFHERTAAQYCFKLVMVHHY
ncbi:hypothetical protein N7478_011559 [Penicillium angulare]|uniref:uncharacterized protein n=1 Tax=Penicillium angulare TaxID=116970 RepID=UPI0025408EFA|nr:uncharacterized protein N7478_011559 [Penicillium angulare]KAJ5263954.1 hypothetical protein N7478_011559 [Penicillium angulare]